MKKIVLVVMILCIPFIAFSQNADTVNSGLNDFSEVLFDTVPNLSTQVGNWPDAFIGKFLPSLPPHFGVGASAGFATLDTTGLSKAASELGISTSGLTENFLIPTIAVDARIGGFFLPFDLGLSFLKADNLKLFTSPITLDFLTVGGSLRYAVLEGNVVLPQLSLGVGYMYNTANISASASGASISTDLNTHTLYAEAQVSKQFLIVTPYAGVRVLFSESTNDWAWKAAILEGSDTNETKLFEDPSVQLNAGVGFNFLIIQLSIGGSYDINNSILGLNTSLRVKL